MKETSLLEFLGANIARSATVEEMPDQVEFYTVLREDGTIISVWNAPEELGDAVGEYYDGEIPVFLNEEELLPWLEMKVAWDEEMDQYSSAVRRPGYQMRGKPVTPEQAFEIIRRTDNFFRFEAGAGPDYIELMNFDSWWFSGNHFPRGYGWCRPDGRIGLDSITQKYPNAYEFAVEWGRLLSAFPFLNLCIVIWEVNEGLGTQEDAVACGICVHDGRIELLNRKHALETFRSYEEAWGDAPETYSDEYYDQNRQVICDQAYLKRCLAANGHDPEQVLSEIQDYIKNLY